MNKLLHFVIPALAPLATLAVHPDRCSGTVSVPTPYGPAKVEWKKDGKIATVETTIPPGFPGQVIEVGGVKITLPANPTACWMPFKAMSYDPVVLQLPAAWSITSAKVKTPLGSGDVILRTGPIYSRIEIFPDKALEGRKPYVAEPGYKLVLADLPPELLGDGVVTGSIVFDFGSASAPPDVLKMIPAAPLRITGLNGDLTCYQPMQGDEVDFANVHGDTQVLVLDPRYSTICRSIPGYTPILELPATDWRTGADTTITATGLPPLIPVVFVVGARELGTPFVIARPDCTLRVDLNPAFLVQKLATTSGEAPLTLSVPSNPALIGRGLAMQAFAVDVPGFRVQPTNHVKARIES